MNRPNQPPPGPVTLFGSGETSASGQKVFSELFAALPQPVRVAILETPAGFELNSDWVARQVAQFLEQRLQNFDPQVQLIPARKLGTDYSPDNPRLLPALLEASAIYLGAGSPTYAIRQLRNSLAWKTALAQHRRGTSLILASASTLAVSAYTIPVYEIYKVGEDPHWQPGLDLFGPWGLSIAVVPHWNNTEGGADLDTSRCFMGQSRFELLYEMLPGGTVVLGIEEHSAVQIDFESACVRVRGKGGIVLIQDGQETRVPTGEEVPLEQLGAYTSPDQDHPVPDQVLVEYQRYADKQRATLEPTEEVKRLVAERESARAARDWELADRLRQEIQALDWQVQDMSDGPKLTPLRDETKA